MFRGVASPETNFLAWVFIFFPAAVQANWFFDWQLWTWAMLQGSSIWTCLFKAVFFTLLTLAIDFFILFGIIFPVIAWVIDVIKTACEMLVTIWNGLVTIFYIPAEIFYAAAHQYKSVENHFAGGAEKKNSKGAENTANQRQQEEFESFFDNADEKPDFDFDEKTFSDPKPKAPRGFEDRHPDDAKLWAIVDDKTGAAGERSNAMTAISKKEAKRNE